MAKSIIKSQMPATPDRDEQTIYWVCPFEWSGIRVMAKLFLTEDRAANEINMRKGEEYFSTAVVVPETETERKDDTQ